MEAKKKNKKNLLEHFYTVPAVSFQKPFDDVPCCRVVSKERQHYAAVRPPFSNGNLRAKGESLNKADDGLAIYVLVTLRKEDKRV